MGLTASTAHRMRRRFLVKLYNCNRDLIQNSVSCDRENKSIVTIHDEANNVDVDIGLLSLHQLFASVSRRLEQNKVLENTSDKNKDAITNPLCDNYDQEMPTTCCPRFISLAELMIVLGEDNAHLITKHYNAYFSDHVKFNQNVCSMDDYLVPVEPLVEFLQDGRLTDKIRESLGESMIVSGKTKKYGMYDVVFRSLLFRQAHDLFNDLDNYQTASPHEVMRKNDETIIEKKNNRDKNNTNLQLMLTFDFLIHNTIKYSVILLFS